MSSRDKTSACKPSTSNDRRERQKLSTSASNKPKQADCKRTNVSKSRGGKSSDSRSTAKQKRPQTIVERHDNETVNSREMATTGYTDHAKQPENLNSELEEEETDVDKLIKPEAEDGLKLERAQRNQDNGSNSSGESTEAVTNDLSNVVSTSEQPLPSSWEQHTDKSGDYFWHISSGLNQRTRPTPEHAAKKDSVIFCHDDEEINQAQKTSSDEDDFYETGAALTADDVSEATYVVYPLGCCEFDETQLVSTTSTKAIQKCILKLSNGPTTGQDSCWGLDQNQPLLMQLFEDYIQFSELSTRVLLRSQPIPTIKTWAVDDDNNFAFVIEETAQPNWSPTGQESVDNALLREPILVCYVFRSIDDDDMSCKVAATLNESINRYKEQMANRIMKSARLQQMVVAEPGDERNEVDSEDDIEATNELTMNVKYIGKTSVPRPTGIDVLNVAIDKCLSDAVRQPQQVLDAQQDRQSSAPSGLVETKLHVSPSSVIVENVMTGEIVVECRIRYLTFMGISRRDIRWCGFIMQNCTSKTFTAHCFECYPTAGHVCEAIQSSCTKMYEKVVKRSRQPEVIGVIPTSSKIRDTLAKTFSRIRLKPMS